jgi:hypothetical protein
MDRSIISIEQSNILGLFERVSHSAIERTEKRDLLGYILRPSLQNFADRRMVGGIEFDP